MSIELIDLGKAAVEIRVVGKISELDLSTVDSKMDQLLEGSTDKVGMLLDVCAATGWTIPGFWQEIKFDIKHYNNISKLAFVSDKSRDKLVAMISKPFTKAEVEFFTKDQTDKAKAWVVQ